MKRHLKRMFLFEQLDSRVLLTASPLSSLLATDNVVAGYSADGTGNNAANSTWGAAGVDLLRTAAAAYANGTSAPAGDTRPSARLISNTIADSSGEDIISERLMSAFAYAWGQFIDHDLDLTTTGTQSFNVSVPTGDPSFDPKSMGNKEIPLNRSIFDPATGTTNARQQINTITAWLDGSMIYGSSTAVQQALRTLIGGKMKTSDGNLLPLNNSTFLPNGTLPMANDAHILPNDQMFAAGDVRANENIELTALQTLFVREHNFWADKIAAANPSLGDEQIFQRARAIVIGELQAITYNQWLPAILGRGALTPYAGYNANVNPGIANEFSTALFRFGHSMLGDDVEFLGNDGTEVADEVSLAQAFFNPELIQQFGIDPILKYLSSDPSSEIDNKVVESVRNFLFGPPGSGGLDLASLNIQRGRDHGLADYNSIRAAYGLPKVKTFADITSDVDLQGKLQQLYGSVDNIDAWVGGLAEDHVAGASVGPLLKAVISDQFQRLRDGDRFWYQAAFSGKLLQQISSTTLADIIQRNTTNSNLQQNVFFFRVGIVGTVFSGTSSQTFGKFQPKVGLAGQTVELIDGDGEVMASATTDALGRYRFDNFDGMGTGKYQVRLTLSVGGVQTVKLSRLVSITRGDQVASVNFDTGIAVPQPPRDPKPPTRGWNPRDHHFIAQPTRSSLRLDWNDLAALANSYDSNPTGGTDRQAPSDGSPDWTSPSLPPTGNLQPGGRRG